MVTNAQCLAPYSLGRNDKSSTQCVAARRFQKKEAAMRRAEKLVVVVCILLLMTGCSAAQQPASYSTVNTTPTLTPTLFPSPTSTRIPFSYTPFEPLLAKVVTVGPLYVTGGSTVPTSALVDAGKILGVMLQHRPDLAQTLRDQGAFTVVSPRDQPICALPYFSIYSASDCKAYGYGGAGGIDGHPITACDERNLLKEPDDPYQRGRWPYSQNICVHELAHTIMDVGLAPSDLERIDQRYAAVQQEGLWSGDYAMKNPMEFWAVMSQFYFWAGPNAPYYEFHHIANGPQALKNYDPQTFALLDSIYRGSANLS
jgi:hypothetical protein